jgi:hypothetical protein
VRQSFSFKLNFNARARANLISKVRERLHRGLVLQMLADGLLHPRHIVPAAEFIGAALESSDEAKAHALVKSHARVV